MNTDTQARNRAKQTLREAIATHNGNTKHAAVIAAIEDLAKLNPTSAPARSEAFMEGG